MHPSTKTRWVWLTGLFALTLCCSLAAQTFNGRILGTVTDASGAAISGAAVTITDVQRGISRALVTDDAGVYNAPNLSPGTYRVRVEGKGFKSVERPSVLVEVAQDVKIDFTLSPGDVQQTVTVTDEVPLLNTTSSTLGGTLSNKEIIELPLSGRNYENLLQLRPGVMRYPGGGFSTTSSNGLRAEDNSYFIEGLFNSEPYSGQAIINGAGIAGDSATILPIDSIQEFNLQQNPPAEYGWKPGSVVNVGLKSGTNALHGSAFIFGRDGALDARNYFNACPESEDSARSLEQFGGSLGGAIIKDRAFFFGAYEGQRYNVGNSFGGVTSPMTIHSTTNAGNCPFGFPGDCANSASDAIADLQEPANTTGFGINQASLKIAGCTAGTVSCNGTGFPTNPNPAINIINGFHNNVNVNNFVAKVDFHINERNSISGMYFFGNNSGTVEDFPELQTKWRSRSIPAPKWSAAAGFGLPTRAGLTKSAVRVQPPLPADFARRLEYSGLGYGLNTGVTGPITGGLPRIGFGGYFFPGLGGFKWPKFQGPDSITQFVDHVSYTAGKHALKFGGDFHYNHVTNAAYGNARGSVTFLGGVVSPARHLRGSRGLQPAGRLFRRRSHSKCRSKSEIPKLHLHKLHSVLFVQDDWRLTRDLTINYGLRYEYNSVSQGRSTTCSAISIPTMVWFRWATADQQPLQPRSQKLRPPLRFRMGHRRQRARPWSAAVAD